MTRFLRAVWCRIAHHRRDASGVPIQRWKLEGAEFVRHCSRCEDGWASPLGLGVVDVVDMPASRMPPKHYSGPVELRDGSWHPLRADAR